MSPIELSWTAKKLYLSTFAQPYSFAPPSPPAGPLVLAGGQRHWTEARGVSPLQGYNQIASNQKPATLGDENFFPGRISSFTPPVLTLAEEA